MAQELKSLSDLFNETSLFRIPDYQRGYAWEEKQLNDFWEDINSIPEGKAHYTGMLSLKVLKKDECNKFEEEKWLIDGRKYKVCHIVDGQQRLTTFIILLNCILNFCKENNRTTLGRQKLEKIREKYIVECSDCNIEEKAYKFGYEVDNPSFEYLKVCILDNGASIGLDDTLYTLRLKEAKDYFNKCIKKLFNESKNDFECIESLYSKLVTELQFNVYYIDDDFDVYVAFETMNNRGKQLSNLEILKNRLIYLTTIFKDDELKPE